MYTGLLVILATVIGLLMNRAICRQAKKWLIAGLLGFALIMFISTEIRMNKYLLGGLILCCIALIVVGFEIFRRNSK